MAREGRFSLKSARWPLISVPAWYLLLTWNPTIYLKIPSSSLQTSDYASLPQEPPSFPVKSHGNCQFSQACRALSSKVVVVIALEMM